MGHIRIQCSVTDDNKIALNRKKNTIVRVLNGKIQEFEIEYREFEMLYIGKTIRENNKDTVFYSTDEEIKTKVLEMLKYTPYLEPDKLIIRKYETNK
jgi:hypothetical protein